MTGMPETATRTHAQTLGQAFHQTLEAYLGEPSHPPDLTHDQAVGEALLAFGRGEAPQTIVDTYNRWARSHSYAAIAWLGLAPVPYPPGTHLVDIQSAVLAVGPGGDFVVVQPPTQTAPASGRRRRLLPPAEWDQKLRGTSLELNRPDPRYGFIVVVEEGDRVVACWAAISTTHLEGLWQAPDHRGNLGTSRALLHTMIAQLQQQGVLEVLTNADTPEVEALLEKVDAHRLPGSTWVLPIPERES